MNSKDLRAQFALMVQSVESSSIIDRFSYDPLMQTLTVRFKNGLDYTYVDVAQDVFESFKAAPSAGKFFMSNVKNKYQFISNKKLTKKEKKNNALRR